eukprot:CAMPEP_0182895350 /NCGR_PEP_ID=MMETSP0034_2-20130328/25625_1 /TAXON_ID=156128 /ORGANISM="Nephroselmis pyriformis, Strain CCMP717" /LENGTH=333 /DNA_ID=CAMNT_0025029175 /DNA_START=44 /DNA_END=1044 /DNA_ORIENTATION=+
MASWDAGSGNPPMADPLRGKGLEAEWLGLEGDDMPCVVLEEEDVEGSPAGALYSHLESVARSRLPEGELKAGFAFKAAGCKLEAFPLSAALRTYVLSLDLSSNRLTTGLSMLGAGGCWLRHLSLANNKLTEVPALPHLPCLISLDLSYNEGLALGEGLEPLEGLLGLELSGCGLEALGDPKTTPLRHLKALRRLNLSENELEGMEDLAALGALGPSLEDLDLTENEVCDGRGYKDKIKSMLPQLRRLDGDGMRAAIKHTARAINLLTDGGSAARMVYDSNLDRSSCSCIEGNAVHPVVPVQLHGLQKQIHCCSACKGDERLGARYDEFPPAIR